jgi:superfamily II DNA/RNA helicase
LIVLPTKELARQVYSFFLKFKNNQFNFSLVLAVGGAD